MDSFSKTCLLVLTISVVALALDAWIWTFIDLFADHPMEEYFRTLEDFHGCTIIIDQTHNHALRRHQQLFQSLVCQIQKWNNFFPVHQFYLQLIMTAIIIKNTQIKEFMKPKKQWLILLKVKN